MESLHRFFQGPNISHKAGDSRYMYQVIQNLSTNGHTQKRGISTCSSKVTAIKGDTYLQGQSGFIKLT